MLRRTLLVFWIWVFPLVAPWAALYAVNALDPRVPLARTSIPREPLRRDHCTWHCHNRGCPHRPALPEALAGDRGLYGATIRGLYRVGSTLSRDRATGYGAANLALLCVGWPLVMYGLWVVAWRQGLELRRRRAARRR